LIDAATKPYSERGFQVVDASEWPPQCSSAGRICRSRPKASELRPGSSSSTNFTLVPIVDSDVAKVWLVEDIISPEEQELMLRRVGELNFSSSPTNHESAQDSMVASHALLFSPHVARNGAAPPLRWCQRTTQPSPASSDDQLHSAACQRALWSCHRWSDTYLGSTTSHIWIVRAPSIAIGHCSFTSIILVAVEQPLSPCCRRRLSRGLEPPCSGRICAGRRAWGRRFGIILRCMLDRHPLARSPSWP